MYRKFGKRCVDIVLGGVVVIPVAVLFVLVAALIKLDDRGPVFYRQPRVGRDERIFTIWKFRSMPVSTQSVPSAALGAPRTTRVGAIIRRLNVDELPQLLQVLRGDMSIVGPRPALPTQQELIRARRQNGAFAVRPGLTGLAQVRAYDGMPDREKASHDGEYAAKVTFARDAMIIFRTFGYLLRRPPTY